LPFFAPIDNAMVFNNTHTIPFAQFVNLLAFSDSIVHFITTRNGSLPPSSQNQFTIGLNGAVANQAVLSNRRMIAEQFDFTPDSFVFASQVHGSRVAMVGEEDRGRGAFDRQFYLPDVDAMVTNRKGICLVTQAADCVPLLFFDPVRGVIGVAHAGWKGTVGRISREVVRVFADEYGCLPSDVIVGIGPSIGPCCYEVGAEVVARVEAAFPSTNGLLMENDKFDNPIFNLWEANRLSLLECGVSPENIEMAGLCTKCQNNFFFSARAGDKGRFGAAIMLRG